MYKRNEVFKGNIKKEYINSTPWWPEDKTCADGAPNILYILLDDTGFGDVGCYGSLIDTPNIDALAADGVRYQNFHVNPMCSPTRASLLSGCNHHAVGMGYLANFSLGFPGYQGCVGKQYGLISETLEENGYNTFMVGKWHLINDDVATPAGPFDEWPLGRGFNKFYGFLSACTNQFYPQLVNGNEFVDPPKAGFEGYHLSEDLTDKAIQYIGDTKSYNPDKPFFGYVAFGAQHSPLQVPDKYIEMYKGKFDEGWHVYRERVLERQKELGIVPADTKLAKDDSLVQDWNSRTQEEQKILAKFMEVYAGFLTHTDEQIGRIINYLKKIGEYDNTIIVFLTDNGASAEGCTWGTDNTLHHYQTEQMSDLVTEEVSKKLGTENTSTHYPTSWAHASNTPLQLYKSWSHNGGVKVPLIISWPKGIKAKGEIRTQYHHVIDINSTILDMCGIEAPEVIKGVQQEPKHGVSMVYTFDHPEEPTRRHVQYYEMLGNRGIWADGWKAVADHVSNPTFDFSKDVWELYNTNEDFSETENLAEKYPDKLKEMIELWYNEAGKYNVLPLLESHMKKVEGYHSKAILRFKPKKEQLHHTIYPEMTGTGNIMLRGSFTVTVYASYKPGDEGVLLSNGDNIGGYALYIQDGKLKFHYNYLGYRHFHVEAPLDIDAGDHRFQLDFVETHPNEGISRIMADGEACGSMFINTRPLFSTHFGSLRLGRFSNVSVTGNMKEKKYYAYTNSIEKAEFNFDRSLDDMDMMLKMEEELKRE